MRRRLLPIAIAGAAVGAAALALVVVLAGGKVAGDGRAMLVATGSSEHRASPDIATVRLGVTARAPTARTALRTASSSLEPVIAAVRRLDVEEVQSLPARLRRLPDSEASGRRPIPFRRFAASQSILVRVGELGELGQLIDAAVAAGATEVLGPRFALADPGAARQAALAEAVADARRSAGAMARGAGLEVRRVLRISQRRATATGPVGGTPTIRETGAMPPIEPGSITVTAAVTVEFAVERV